jgi:hypothetical protein
MRRLRYFSAQGLREIVSSIHQVAVANLLSSVKKRSPRPLAMAQVFEERQRAAFDDAAESLTSSGQLLLCG